MVVPLCYVCCFVMLAAGGPARLAAQDAPVEVTTDTPDYCAYLERLAASPPDAPDSVRHLRDEGRQMCDAGQVRAGIARLRRAVVALRGRAGGR